MKDNNDVLEKELEDKHKLVQSMNKAEEIKWVLSKIEGNILVFLTDFSAFLI